VAAGRFREDLYFRLNVFPIHLPPLKERRDDIPLLMEAFLRRYRQQHQRQVPGFTPRAVRALLQYDFPGNIRELQNLVERGVILAGQDEPIDVHHLFRSGEVQGQMPLGLGEGGRLTTTRQPATSPSEGAGEGAGRRPSKNRQEAQQYRNALVASRYNVAEAARQLGLTRAQLAYRLKRLGLD
jgi:transcriptional regulator with GAF, ATPase, and Fis domain